MTNSYEIQQRAQEEIDGIIGRERLPNFEDRTSLPYVEAIYREVLRWQPVVPFAIFHATTGEDIYRDFYIPKGATVIPNIQCVKSACYILLDSGFLRAMTRDPKKYHEPEVFNPSRFLCEDGTLNDDDVEYVFGFGRRWAVVIFFSSQFLIKSTGFAQVAILRPILFGYPLFACSLYLTSAKRKMHLGMRFSLTVATLLDWWCKSRDKCVGDIQNSGCSTFLGTLYLSSARLRRAPMRPPKTFWQLPIMGERIFHRLYL